MSYPPYPSSSGAPYPPSGGYPQPSPGPWAAGGMPNPPGGMGGMPMPGTGSTPGYPPQPGGYPSSSFPPSYPPETGTGSIPGYPPNPDSSYPPGGPTPSYPSGPSSSYPTGPMPSYPPAPNYPPGPPSSNYPPGPANYPPGPPSSNYPPSPANYPPGPANYPPGPPSSNYPPGPPQSTYPSGPSSGAVPPGSYPQPVPVPSDATRKGSIEQTQRQMAAMSVSKPVPVTHGTVKPSPKFNPEADATTLYNAMKGLGTDEKAIILVLTRRSNEQRQEIKVKFKVKYGKDLDKELKSELSGHFREVIIGLMMTPTEYDAHCLYKAMEGAGTDETTLIEILCSRTNVEKEAIKAYYKKEYKNELEKDIRSETSGHFRRLLISLTAAARDPDSIVDKARAKQDAQALYQAGEGKWGTDESMFNQILCARSYAHLRLVFEEYSKICKYDIEQSISREMSGDLKTGMTTIVKCVRNLPGYFAERLYKSMKGLGTDDKTLVRVMVSRCEVDMVEIKSVFERTYGKTLDSFIKGDTSGDYKKALLALAGEY